jgi:hypothetical protein
VPDQDSPRLEPSDSYIKQRRAVIIASGLLFVATIVGIESPNGEQSLLPFRLKESEALAPILAFIVLYNSYLFVLNWGLQITTIRDKRSIRNDFRITLAVASASILTYIASLTPITNIAQITIPTLQTFNLPTGTADILAGITTGLAAYFAIGPLFKIWQREINARLFVKATNELKIQEALKHTGWVLNFNFSHPKGKKQIEFLPDGEIGLGKNNNETTWRLRDGFLELLNAKGQVHSRFKYIHSENKFLHTNDEDTLSLKPQEIYLDLNFRD